MRRLLSLFGVVALIAGCAPAATGGPAATAAGPNFTNASVLNIRVEGAWTSFSPSVSNLPSQQINQGLYDRLVYMDPQGKLAPWLATSWEATPSTLKFNIKKGVNCSDQTPLTPSAIAKYFDWA